MYRRLSVPSRQAPQSFCSTPVRGGLLKFVALILILGFFFAAIAPNGIVGAGKNSNLRTTTTTSDQQKQTLTVPKGPVLGEYDEETGFYQSIALLSAEPLVKKQSKYQTIEVYESKHFGKILRLDNVLQLTERDGDAYNEMMAHVPMFAHPEPKKVLLIGGGDGYVLNEILKHDSVEHVDHVELDGEVIETCRDLFSWGDAWDDPRAHLHLVDGAHFVASSASEMYDVVIQDSSDPWTWDERGALKRLPSSVLFESDHYRQIYRILKNNGVFNFQAESFAFPSDLEGMVAWRRQLLDIGFERSRYGTITIPTYPTGQIGFMLSEKKVLEQPFESRYRQMVAAGGATTYYHPRLQSSAFDLPLWVTTKMSPI